MKPRTKLITLAVVWAALLKICVPAPRTVHTAFHSRAAWRSLLGRPVPSAVDRRVPSVQTTQLHGTKDLVDKISQLFGIESSKRQSYLEDVISSSASSSGQVIRTAARSYQQSGGSIPSSRYYTTRKDSLPMISIAETGVDGDYNHYRTVALKSTSDRAVSILTNDVGTYIRSINDGIYANKYREGKLQYETFI